MPANTPNYNLKKPVPTDNFDVEDQNGNMDLIDAALAPTADPTQVPTGLSGKLSQWVSWITNRIKAITGGSNWYDAPATTLQAAKIQMDTTQNGLNTHLVDKMHIPYVVDIGSLGNAKVITLNPAPAEYIEGMALSFKNAIQNSGAVTINVNGLGTKSILKSNGNTLASGNLKVGSIYTIRYNGTSFILQGDGGSGDATASDLRSGKTASTDAGDITGTVPTKGNTPSVGYEPAIAIATPSASGRIYLKAPKGIYDVDTYIYYDDADLIAVNIKQGVDIMGLVGTYQFTFSPGENLQYTDGYENFHYNTAYTLQKQCTVGMKGTFRVKFRLYNKNYEERVVYGRLRKNGIDTGTERVNTTSAIVTYTEDISLEPGDVLSVYSRTGNGGYAVAVSTFTISTAEGSLFKL